MKRILTRIMGALCGICIRFMGIYYFVDTGHEPLVHKTFVPRQTYGKCIVIKHSPIKIWQLGDCFCCVYFDRFNASRRSLCWKYIRERLHFLPYQNKKTLARINFELLTVETYRKVRPHPSAGRLITLAYYV